LALKQSTTFPELFSSDPDPDILRDTVAKASILKCEMLHACNMIYTYDIHDMYYLITDICHDDADTDADIDDIDVLTMFLMIF